MYIRPRRQTSRRKGISLRRVLVWVFAPILILLAAGAFYMREDLQRLIAPLVDSLARQAADTVATIQAPTAVPTQDPSDSRRLADTAWQNGQFQESVRLYEQILSALPNDVSAHYYYTLGLIMQGRIDDAVRAAEDTVTANPFSSDGWAIRAMALNRAERLTDSIVSALRAVELNPESARAHAFLAESYADLERFSRAEQEIEDALELNPDSYEAHYVNGRYQWEINFDFGAARIELEEAYDLSNGAAHVGLNLGRLLLYGFESDADHAEGLSLLGEILDRNPDNAAILYELGVYSWRTQGDNERAETYLRRCVSAVPSDIGCNYELGRVLNNLGQTDEARQAFERTIDLGSRNPYHYWWSGSAQVSSAGDCTSAMQYFQPGYQIVLTELSAGTSIYNSMESLEGLKSDYQSAMAPCMGGSAFPTDVPEVTPEVES